MSILACNRIGCKNIMCDRYSERYGYLCYSCFEELIDTVIYQRQFPLSLEFIQEFMDSTKQDYSGTVIELVETQLAEIFPLTSYEVKNV